jgi:hypothetical protein
VPANEFLALVWSPRSPLAAEKFGQDSGVYPGLCNPALWILKSGGRATLDGEPSGERHAANKTALASKDPEPGRSRGRAEEKNARLADRSGVSRDL